MLVFRGHRSPIHQMAFSPDGALLASIAGQGYAVSLWDATTGTREAYLSTEYRTPLSTIAFLPKKQGLLCTPKWGYLYRWDLQTFRESRVSQTHFSGWPIFQIVASVDGNTVYVAFQSWQSISLQKLDLTLTKQHPKAKQVKRIETGYPNPSECISMSLAPNQKWIAMAILMGQERRLTLIDLENKKELDVEMSNVSTVAFSPDGRQLALNRGNEIVLLDTQDWQEIATWSQHTANVNSLAYSPDGRLLLSGGDDERVRIWNLAQEREVQSFNWELGKITQVTFASDGMRAAAGGDGQMIIWDVEE